MWAHGTGCKKRTGLFTSPSAGCQEVGQSKNRALSEGRFKETGDNTDCFKTEDEQRGCIKGQYKINIDF